MAILVAKKKDAGFAALAAGFALVIAAAGVLSFLTLHGAGAALNYLTPEALEFLTIDGGFI